MKKLAKKNKGGRPRKAIGTKCVAITITLSPARLQKVDRRGANRSAAIGAMIDEAEG